MALQRNMVRKKTVLVTGAPEVQEIMEEELDQEPMEEELDQEPMEEELDQEPMEEELDQEPMEEELDQEPMEEVEEEPMEEVEEEPMEEVEEEPVTKKVVKKPVTKKVVKKKTAVKKVVKEESSFNFNKNELESKFALALTDELGAVPKAQARRIIGILEDVINENAIQEGKSFYFLKNGDSQLKFVRKIINGRAMPLGPVNKKDSLESYKSPSVTLKLITDCIGGEKFKGTYDKENRIFTTVDGVEIDIDKENKDFIKKYSSK